MALDAKRGETVGEDTHVLSNKFRTSTVAPYISFHQYRLIVCVIRTLRFVSTKSFSNFVITRTTSSTTL